MFQQEIIERLKQIILPALEEDGVLLVELRLIRSFSGIALQLLADKIGGGITLDECARINFKIGGLLDEQGLELGRYILEVSSPGIDRPLKTKNDFLRCINKRARFFLSEAVNNKLEFEGLISKLEDNIVFVDIDGLMVSVDLNKINKAKQIIN